MHIFNWQLPWHIFFPEVYDEKCTTKKKMENKKYRKVKIFLSDIIYLLINYC